jgi:hypothetical protein
MSPSKSDAKTDAAELSPAAKLLAQMKEQFVEAKESVAMAIGDEKYLRRRLDDTAAEIERSRLAARAAKSAAKSRPSARLSCDRQSTRAFTHSSKSNGRLRQTWSTNSRMACVR